MALSQTKIDLIIALVKKGGMSNVEVSKEVGCSESAVRTTIKKQKHNGTKETPKETPNERRNDSSLYIINAEGTNFYKIGVANDVGYRLRHLQTAHYQELSVLRSFYCKNAYDAEKQLHSKYTDRGSHIRGEWFILDNDDIKDIERFIYGTQS